MSDFPHRHRHLGLILAANVELEGFEPAGDGPVDVQVEVIRASRPAPFAGWNRLDPSRPAWRAPGEGGTRLRLHFQGPAGDWVEFVIEPGGDRATMTLSEDSPFPEACELFAAGVFSCLLAQRGVTCLHAAVVAIGTQAFALLGSKEAGKSTLALALTRQGAALVCDDVAAIARRDDRWVVAAARPVTRVTATTADGLGGAYESLRPIWDESQPRPRKRYHDVRGTPAACLPLGGVVLLAPRGGVDEPQLHELSQAELLPALISERHMAFALDRAGHRHDFAQLAAMVGELGAWELRRPDSLEAVPRTAELLHGVIGRGDTTGDIR